MSITCESDIDDHVKKEALPKSNGTSIPLGWGHFKQEWHCQGHLLSVMSYNRQ